MAKPLDLPLLIDAEVKQLWPQVSEIRRHLHKNPELTWNEKQTAQYVFDFLQKIPGMQVSRYADNLGVVGLLKGAEEGPVVGLRADMDALPIVEKTGAAHQSANKGVMHACGHDGHVANLLGTALLLSNFRARLKGAVKFIFQPAEEGGHGAKKMCEEGVLENPRVDVIFGLHGWPEAPLGKIVVKKGPLLAANVQFYIDIEGKGGHAAFPHLSCDPILAAARIVDGLQTIVSRNFAPVEPLAVTVAQFNAGTATNVIPKDVSIAGTIRSVDKAVLEECQQRLVEIATYTAKAHRVEAKVRFQAGYPVTYNDPKTCETATDLLTKCLGSEAIVHGTFPSMGAEDFSYYLEQRPGVFFFLGLDDTQNKDFPSLHSPYFDFNDNALKVGMRLFSHLALQWSEMN
ncbi:MAG: M20 family metallopeptidase [Oligoflexales bacterium]